MHPNFKDLNANYKFVFKLGDFEVKLYKKPGVKYLKEIIEKACDAQIFSDEKIPECHWSPNSESYEECDKYWAWKSKVEKIKDNSYVFCDGQSEPDSFSDIKNNNIILFQRKFDYDTRKQIYGKQKIVPFTIEKYK